MPASQWHHWGVFTKGAARLFRIHFVANGPSRDQIGKTLGKQRKSRLAPIQGFCSEAGLRQERVGLASLAIASPKIITRFRIEDKGNSQAKINVGCRAMADSLIIANKSGAKRMRCAMPLACPMSGRDESSVAGACPTHPCL